MKGRVAAEYLLNIAMFHEPFLCSVHWSTGQSMTHRIIASIYFNNERKIMTDSVHKDNVILFKNDKGKSSNLFNCFCSSFYSYRRYFLISYDCTYCKKTYFYIRSSSPEVFCKKDVLKNFTKSTVKHLRQSLFLIKLQSSLLKKRLWHRGFSVNFVKFLRTSFLTKYLLATASFTFPQWWEFFIQSTGHFS